MFVEKENSLNESDSQAEYLCRQALANAGFAFGNPPATFHWSQLINPAGDKKAAIDAYEALLIQEPENKSAMEGLAYIYQVMGYHEQARHYRRQLRKIELNEMGLDTEKHPETLSYVLSKTGEAEQPDRVPAVYVSAHFDRYASFYDQQLCEDLKYSGHLLIKQLCEQWVLPRVENPQVLDVGCGTGLTGEALGELFAIIDGVDLSANMLQRARSRKVYRELTQGDYHDYLQNSVSKYDVITASDVFIYEGDLAETFQEVYAALKGCGYLIFTLEKAGTNTFCLRNTGRFQHSENYIQQLADRFRFTVLSKQDVVIRMNGGQDVESLVFTLQKM